MSGRKAPVVVKTTTTKVVSGASLNTSNKRSPSRKQKKGKKGKKGQGRLTESLSPCASEYAFALRDPFEGPLTCVPSTYPPLPSMKVRVWSKGYASLGTTGTGFVMISPMSMFAGDAASVATSGVTGAYLGFPATTAAPTVTAGTNAPYQTAQLGTTFGLAQCRVVSVGLRVWYIGSQLELQGEMVGLRSPDNDSIAGALGTNVLAFPSSRRVAVDSTRATLDVNWIPTRPIELEFQSAPILSYTMGIYFTGKISYANCFAYETSAVLEYIGSNVPSRSMSHADPAGFAAVLTAAQSDGDTWYGMASNAGASLVKSAKEVLYDLSGPAVRGATRYAMNAALGNVMGNMGPGLNSLLPAIKAKPGPDANAPFDPSDPNSLRPSDINIGPYVQVSNPDVGQHNDTQPAPMQLPYRVPHDASPEQQILNALLESAKDNGANGQSALDALGRLLGVRDRNTL